MRVRSTDPLAPASAPPASDSPISAAPAAETPGPKRLLLTLTAFLVALFVGSNAALTHSETFWRFSKRGGLTGSTAPLVFESTLRGIAPGRREVLFVGSSVVERDIDPLTVATSMGLRVKNVFKLPLLGASSLETAMLTRQLVDRRPKVIVYLATPWTLQNHVDWDLLRFYDPVAAVNVFSWREILADHATHASSLLGASHVVIRHRSYLRALLFDPILEGMLTRPVHAPGAGEVVRRRWAERLGARLGDFGCDNPNVRGLAWMARRLSAAGITFIVVATPVSGKQGRDPELARLADECLFLQASEAGFTFLPREIWGEYPRDHFYDPVHMSATGRMRFSDALGRALAERFPAVREID